uniref:Uncharacterized protein n=1 Tax=Physcomitrium patens TaxID=3218 RepID=A0A2K1ISL9_PHYPA|nr:hypothetical protein PHYPA_026399 [Physcomitrium patens]
MESNGGPAKSLPLLYFVFVLVFRAPQVAGHAAALECVRRASIAREFFRFPCVCGCIGCPFICQGVASKIVFLRLADGVEVGVVRLVAAWLLETWHCCFNFWCGVQAASIYVLVAAVWHYYFC